MKPGNQSTGMVRTPQSDPLADLSSKLDAVLAGQARILELLSRPSRLRRGDRARLERMLPAVAGALGSELFAVKELMESSLPAVQLVTRGISDKKLGWLLKRAEGQAIGGYTVRREGDEHGAALWRVLAVVVVSGGF